MLVAIIGELYVTVRPDALLSPQRIKRTWYVFFHSKDSSHTLVYPAKMGLRQWSDDAGRHMVFVFKEDSSWVESSRL
jgi:hypothetical protein